MAVTNKDVPRESGVKVWMFSRALVRGPAILAVAEFPGVIHSPIRLRVHLA
jgi:hypothetical protein